MIYSNQEKNTRISELLKTPRMYFLDIDDQGGVNRINGLLDLCCKYIKSTDTVVEIGSFQGVSSRTIALHCNKLYCVDPWEWQATVDAEKVFDSILKDYPNINKIKSNSVEASKLFEDNSLDLVYIDGDHSYDAIMQDISAWFKKVKINGYIAGHDNYIDDVRRAVTNNFGENYETFSDTSWIIQKRNS